MSETETLLFKAQSFINQLNAIENTKLSPTLQSYLSFLEEIKIHISGKQGEQKTDRTLVQKKDVIDVISTLKYAFYNFFPNLKDEAAQAMVQVWYNYLKQFKAVVLQDAVAKLVSTPSDYGKAPNLPDIIYACESIKFNEKYKERENT